MKKPITVKTTATFSVVPSKRQDGYSVHVTFGTGDYLHLCGPYPTANEAWERLESILEKRGIEHK